MYSTKYLLYSRIYSRISIIFRSKILSQHVLESVYEPDSGSTFGQSPARARKSFGESRQSALLPIIETTMVARITFWLARITFRLWWRAVCARLRGRRRSWAAPSRRRQAPDLPRSSSASAGDPTPACCTRRSLLCSCLQVWRTT